MNSILAFFQSNNNYTWIFSGLGVSFVTTTITTLFHSYNNTSMFSLIYDRHKKLFRIKIINLVTIMFSATIIGYILQNYLFIHYTKPSILYSFILLTAMMLNLLQIPIRLELIINYELIYNNFEKIRERMHHDSFHFGYYYINYALCLLVTSLSLTPIFDFSLDQKFYIFLAAFGFITIILSVKSFWGILLVLLSTPLLCELHVNSEAQTLFGGQKRFIGQLIDYNAEHVIIRRGFNNLFISKQYIVYLKTQISFISEINSLLTFLESLEKTISDIESKGKNYNTDATDIQNLFKLIHNILNCKVLYYVCDEEDYQHITNIAKTESVINNFKHNYPIIIDRKSEFKLTPNANDLIYNIIGTKGDTRKIRIKIAFLFVVINPNKVGYTSN